MNFYFEIDYKTVYGEELILNVMSNDPSGKETTSEYRMSTVDGEHWEYNLKVDEHIRLSALRYYYSVDCDGKQTRCEWTLAPHRIDLSVERGQNYTTHDRWEDIPEDAYLYSAAFTDCINRRKTTKPTISNFPKTLRLKVHAPQLRANERLALSGNATVIGAWSMTNAVDMSEYETNVWTVDINANTIANTTIDFKFVVLDRQDDMTPIWECGFNHAIHLPYMVNGDVAIYELGEALFPIPDRKLAGTLVPVFSLRTVGSFGVGDFGDLKTMVDFIAATHQSVLQILPINDTTTTHTWTDSYPYSCISIFALHPQYVDVRQLPTLKDKAKAKEFESLRKELNDLNQIDYERVNNTKTEYLKLIFEQEGKQVLASNDFKAFFNNAESWLVPYAQYCLLREKYGTTDFSKWIGHKTWNEKDRKSLCSPRGKDYKELSFYFFVQYILHTQMKQTHDYARTKGVILKGDIPIGVSRQGCDVWMEPRYFNMDSQAGAPPDDFSVNGQNWGFPTYNWEEMVKDNCIWWVRRFQNMQLYFDAYRIDHVLGFFRIWQIPISSVHGLLGQFSPSLGMTRDEIESYGLKFQEDYFTKPFITDWILDRMFQEKAQEIKTKYLDKVHDDVYNLKPAYDTQRKIEAAFASSKSIEEQNVRDGLYALVSDVLFVRDTKDSNKFHPRITAQFNFIYEALWDNDKNAFNKLYNDYYYRRNNHFWYREAMKKLPKLVQATSMLVCAEDLGMVPDCVAWVMQQLRILSLEVQSMPKDPKVRFGHLSRNPYRSVCTISSHDMPTLRQWWDENIERTQDYYNSMLHRSGGAPHPLSGWLARDIISRHLTSPSMLCILSIQDWLAIDENIRLANQDAERINIPANPKHYWRYRMHLNIEDIMANSGYMENLSELILQSGRK